MDENSETKFSEMTGPGIKSFMIARHMSHPAALSFAAIVEAARSLAYDGRLPLKV
jgi:hypothetical protein